MSAKRRSGKGGRGGFAWLPGLMVGALIIGLLATGQIRIPGVDDLALPDFGIGTPTDVEGIDPQLPDLGELIPDSGSGGNSGGSGSSDGRGRLAGLEVGYSPAEALDALDDIPVATSMATGYDRVRFGSGWASLRGWGCDARNVTLARDLVDVTYQDGTDSCVVLTGTLHGPYSGDTIDFQRGQDTSRAVQIDHIVPVATAWRLGAHAWTDAEREAFYNDLDNLLAVDGPTNGAKGDGTLGEWQPPNSAERCDYAAQYVYVTAKYDLAMLDDDVTYARELLPTCS